MSYIIGCDIGTTNVKTTAFDSSMGSILASHSVGHEMSHPKPDWSEQDPDEIYNALCVCVKETISKSKGAGKLLGFCFSSAMHSVMAVDKNGNKLTSLIIWADNRSSKIADQLRKSEDGKKIYDNNGTPIHAMTPVCKLIWLRENQEDIFESAAKFIGIKEYLIFRLTGKFVIDYSIASATGLFNIREKAWDSYTLNYIGLPENKLSTAVSPYHQEPLPENNGFGVEAGTPLVMGASDGCLANLGGGAINFGSMAVTIGTSGAARICSDVAYSDPEMRTFCYLLDENIYIIGGPSNNGAVIFEWLMNTFFANEEYDAVLSETTKIAAGADGLIFYPYLLGERAPLWNSEVRGGFSGLGIEHTRFHFAKAVLEGILLNLDLIADILFQMRKVDTIYASGGFAKSPIWVQMLADVFGKKVVLNETIEAGATGAAMMGLKALGIYNEYSEMSRFTVVGKEFDPDKEVNQRYKDISKQFKEGAKYILHKCL